MSESLNQTFEKSREATENYFAYIARQNNEQMEQGKGAAHSLNSVVENVNTVGMVAAMAAKESMQSHNTIFGMLKTLNTRQSLVTQMIVELRQNGGVGGSGGGMVEGALGWGGFGASVASFLELSQPWFWVPLVAGALIGATEESDQETAKQGELNHPNSLTNKALEASAEAEKLINQAYYSLNPAPNPLMNGPGMLLGGIRRRDLPETKTFGETMTVGEAINGANAYLETTGQIPTRPRIRDDYSPNDEYGNLMRHNGVEPDEMTRGLNTEYDQLMRYNSQAAIAAMPPQPAQVVVQTAPSEAPEQTINIHMNNEIKGAIYDSRAFKDLSDYLVERLREQFNRRGVRYSDNW